MIKRIISFILSLFGISTDNQEDPIQETGNSEEPNEQNDPNEPQQNEPQQQMNDYSNIIVHIDNGHASTTGGKRSPYALYGILPELDFYEYKFNREVAAILKNKLEEKGFVVNMVCPEIDVDVKLTTRANRANAVKDKNPGKKNIFISIHANACGNGKEWNKARGWCAYTTKGQNNSDKLSECLYDAAEEILPTYNMTIRTDKSDGDRDYEENFTVIYTANMPAVLTENLFYTNTTDTEFLMSDVGKEAIAEIHLRGIMKYSDKYLIK